jgi:type I restriction enzyme M protein
MADEKGIIIPNGCTWEAIKKESGPALIDLYADTLGKLRKEKGLLGDIFAQSVPRFNNL